jgi:hypothetical protein
MDCFILRTYCIQSKESFLLAIQAYEMENRSGSSFVQLPYIHVPIPWHSC